MRSHLAFFLFLTFINGIYGNLIVQSCVEIVSVNSLTPVPGDGNVYVTVWVDHDHDNAQDSTTETGVTDGATWNVDETFCFDYTQTDFTDTGFYPNQARVVTISINDDIVQGYIYDDFTVRSDFTNSVDVASVEKTTDLSSNGGTITFKMYHQYTGDLMKISNRNHMIYRDCYLVYSLCFYDADGTCNVMSAETDAVSPDNGQAATEIGYISGTTKGTVWPSTSNTATEDCWEPYDQYIIVDISGFSFTAIGFGLDADSFSTTEYQDDGLPPKYFSFAFGPSSVSDYSDDSAWVQYWAIDLSDSAIFPDQESGDADYMFFNINPLWFMRDTYPTDLNNRFTGITSGMPEMYSDSVSLYYSEDNTGGTLTSFTTWTTWHYWGSGDTAQTDQVGYVATIACQNVYGSGSDYSNSLSDFGIDLGGSPFSYVCWGTADGTCLGVVWGPPMRYYVLTSDTLDWCDGTSGKTEWQDCPDDPDVSTSVYDCNGNSDCNNDDYFSVMIGSITCSGMAEKVTSVQPSEDPSAHPSDAPSVAPTLAPTDAPSVAPTDAPYDAPTSAPSLVPSVAPTDSPNNDPTDGPTSAPSRVPFYAPTSAPTAAPTLAPSATPVEGVITTTQGTMATTQAAVSTTAAEPEPIATTTETPVVSGGGSGSGEELGGGGGNNDGPEDFFRKYLWYIIGITVIWLFCCILIVLVAFGKCKREKKEKEPRVFGDAKVVEMQKNGLPRPLSASDQQAERIRPDRLLNDDMGGDEDDELYGGPTGTRGDPAVTGKQTEGEGGTDGLNRRVSEGLEGGDPAVTGSPGTQGGPTPNGGGLPLASSVSTDPLRPSVASDASDVFSSPEEAAMNEVRQNQFMSTDAGPDAALEVLVGNSGKPQPANHHNNDHMHVGTHEDDNEVVLGMTQGGDDEIVTRGGSAVGGGLPKEPKMGNNMSVASNSSVTNNYTDQNSKNLANYQHGNASVQLEYGSNSNENRQAHQSNASNGDAISVKSETLLGMADGDGET